MAFIHSKIKKRIFSKKSFVSCDEFVVVSGYLGPSPIKDLDSFLKKCKIHVNIKIVYGMYGKDGIFDCLNESLKTIQRKSGTNFSILYSSSAVHSKCYVWRQGGKVIKAFVGSANFTDPGLTIDDRESLVEAPSSDYPKINSYVDSIISNSVPCTNANIIITSSPFPWKASTAKSKGKGPSSVLPPPPSSSMCMLSLLQRNGKVPKEAGINWCLSKKGKVSPLDGCVKVSAENVRLFPFLFPQKTGKATAIDIIWDDGKSMKGSLEGSQSVARLTGSYPKQLSTIGRKSVFGRYLRKRILGRRKNLKVLITKNDLLKYGRTDIGLTLVNGVYYLDFHV
jgi:hypothetical protein